MVTLWYGLLPPARVPSQYEFLKPLSSMQLISKFVAVLKCHGFATKRWASQPMVGSVDTRACTRQGRLLTMGLLLRGSLTLMLVDFVKRVLGVVNADCFVQFIEEPILMG